MLSKRLSGAALGAAVAIGAGLSVLPAQAAYVLTLKQESGNVVATGSGTIDLAGLTFDEISDDDDHFMSPSLPGIATGAFFSNVAFYFGAKLGQPAFTGPSNFGSGGSANASSGSGDFVALEINEIGVPAGYVSGSKLSSSATWDDTNFAMLGVTPGVYTWKLTNGDSFTVDAVPEPSTWIMMLVGFAGLGLAAWRAGKTTERATRSLC